MNDNSEPGNNARVEAYLDQLLVPLARNLSDFHREELRRELRAHLWERAEAYQELGHAGEEAVTEALKQFGGAENFRRQWQRQWLHQKQTLTLEDVGQATRRALLPSLLMILLAYLPGLFAALDLWICGPDNWWDNHFQLFTRVWYLEIAALPVGFGLLLGRCLPRTAAWGVFGALAVDCAAGGAINTLANGWGFPQSLLSQMVGCAALLSVAWMPVACATAGLTGWWTRRTEARQLA